MYPVPHRKYLDLLSNFSMIEGEHEFVGLATMIPSGPYPIAVAYECDSGVVPSPSMSPSQFSPSPFSPSPSPSPSASPPGFSAPSSEVADTARIEVSADGTFWVPFADITCSGTARGIYTTTIFPIVARWIRVRVSAPTSHEVTLWNIQLWHSQYGVGDQ